MLACIFTLLRGPARCWSCRSYCFPPFCCTDACLWGSLVSLGPPIAAATHLLLKPLLTMAFAALPPQAYYGDSLPSEAVQVLAEGQGLDRARQALEIAYRQVWLSVVWPLQEWHTVYSHTCSSLLGWPVTTCTS